MRSTRSVVVVIGAGGIGTAVARRLGSGKHLVIGNRSTARLESIVSTLTQEGQSVQGHTVDIGDPLAVSQFADQAAEAGAVTTIVHTAGVSPETASTDDILRIDLLGTAHVIESFLPVATPGSSMVCISSQAGYFATLPAGVESHLAAAPVSALLDPEGFDLRNMPSRYAYMVAKRANQLRVAGAALAWGERGARINSISPGLVATSMGHAELHGRAGAVIRESIAQSPLGRIGTADEVAAAVDFLASSMWTTGSDLLMDGGAYVRTRWAE